MKQQQEARKVPHLEFNSVGEATAQEDYMIINLTYTSIDSIASVLPAKSNR